MVNRSNNSPEAENKASSQGTKNPTEGPSRASPSHRTIKRYSNRKLYDTTRSKYVTLEEIASMIKEGEEIQIVDNKTSRDLTAITLAQIIYEEEKRKSRMPLAMLRRLIQNSGDALEDFIDRSVKTPVAEMKGSAQKGMEEFRQSAATVRESAAKSIAEWTDNVRRIFSPTQSERLERKINDSIKKIDEAINEAHVRVTTLLNEASKEEVEMAGPLIKHVQHRLSEMETRMTERQRELEARKATEGTDPMLSNLEGAASALEQAGHATPAPDAHEAAPAGPQPEDAAVHRDLPQDSPVPPTSLQQDPMQQKTPEGEALSPRAEEEGEAFLASETTGA